MSDTTTAGRELRRVPLSSIEPADGHNPRGTVEVDSSIQALADNIADRGMLQPLVVCSTETGYRIIAGERRYRAAMLASLAEVPVAIDHRPADHPDLEEERFADSMSENLLQEDMSLLAIARGFHRQKTRGKRTVKEIAAMYGRSQVDVRNHLAVLDLSDEVQRKIDAGVVPLTVAVTLAQLAGIHRELPELAVSRVLQTHSGITWPALNRYPITTVSNSYARLGGKLPSDVFELHGSYPIDRFNLNDEAKRALAELHERYSRSPDDLAVLMDRGTGDAAKAMRALHVDKDGRAALIVGQDLADQLACDAIQAELRRQQAADRARKQADQAAAQPTTRTSTPGAPAETADERADRERERQVRAEIERRAGLDAKKAARESACTHNDRLGARLFRDMSRVKIDDRVLKILTAVPIGGRLSDIAMSGARFGFPDWVTVMPGRGDVPKRVYLQSTEAKAKAREYLSGAKTPGEIAGRSLALVVMAMNAQQEAVPQGQRASFAVSSQGMPWEDEVLVLLDELAAEIVGAETLGAMYANRIEKRALAAADAKRRVALGKRLARMLKNIKKLSDEELDEIPSLVAAVHRGYIAEERNARVEVTARFEREHERRIAELAGDAPDTVDGYKKQSEARRKLNKSVRTVLDVLGKGLTIDMLKIEDLAQFDDLAESFFVGDKDQLARVKALADTRRLELTASTSSAGKPGPADGDHSTKGTDSAAVAAPKEDAKS
jgi:ParB/RepB/Spo0J family partition protein